MSGSRKSPYHESASLKDLVVFEKSVKLPSIGWENAGQVEHDLKGFLDIGNALANGELNVGKGDTQYL